MSSLNVVKGDILNYSYTGASQSITLPKGIYKLECWGAQGGNYDATYTGGKGGYSTGVLTLKEDTNLYLYVGGQGTGGTTTGTKAGGFNGGGAGYTGNGIIYTTAGGGGTDIRIGQDSLYARVIVAGGGGGRTYSSALTSYSVAGGVGGGENGTAGASPSTGYLGGTGGSQTSIGISYLGTTVVTSSTAASKGVMASFGVGGRGGSSGYSCGGGGGWYGGGFASQAGGGGGSGYVYTESTANNYPSGCLLTSSYYLTEVETIAGNQTIPLSSGSTGTGNSGNGAIRITVVKVGNFPLWIKEDSNWLQGKSLYTKINNVWQEVSEDNINNYINANMTIKNKHVWRKYSKLNDTHVKALITFDDMTYKDIINDVSPTITGTPSLTKGKFSNAAIFPANNSHYMDIVIPNLTTILNTNQWTFDWWEYCLGFTNDASAFVLSSHNQYTMISSYASTSGATAKYFYASANGSSWDIANHIKMGSQLGNQWVHRAIVRNGSSIKLFENGVLINEVTSSSLIRTQNDNIRFSYVWGSQGLNGYLDEFRFSDMPRWSTNFEVPTTPSGLEFISYTFDTNIDAYPKDGIADDGYYYKRL